ncbi:HlyD family type I secretion periplasmic adaptor subunit [Metapseudomonas otitidis]|uniref:HlyD family type I secretion periplasmic adaptor subunit n=2 Tax=Metapseudomonas otitidis TaxID=319939 RepID=UPI00244730CB|nr:MULTISPECIES: HlyD family type I secretion periplasmic adaptor subunit [Pseudomonas]MDH1109038.1 HlyD family type I secretion periplasmic adaptor subunit [Pseudomonas otitidis]MDH1164453.1 HlyD family type I secretion periplasmic adaptor subunit [Pseudomonas otitidis]MDL5599087.1 HlyD family type I secretion periplasmic adaptor subunit [Bacillus subtilis]
MPALPDAPRPLADVLPLDDHRPARLGRWLVLAGFGGFLLWAALAPLDKGVAVSGSVVVAGHRQAVQHPTGGVVARLLVHDGEAVSAGQVLLTLDATRPRAERDTLRQQYRDAQAAAVRLAAETEGQAQLRFPPSLPADDPDMQASQALHQQLFASRREAQRLQQAALREGLAGARAHLAGLESAQRYRREQRQALLQQLQGLRGLAQEGYIPRNRLLESERLLAQLDGELGEAVGAIGHARQQVQELGWRERQQAEEYRRDLHQQQVENRLRLGELASRLASAEFELAHTEVRAPVAGTLVGLAVFTPGGVIAPGQQLMEVVPRDAPLLVDARAPVELVDRLRPGLPVELLFAAFNQSSTPRVPGELVLVSADRLLDEQTREPYYQVRIRVSEDGTRQLAGLDIRPGMPVQAFVRTGERSLLNYLFKPLADRLHLALSED